MAKNKEGKFFFIAPLLMGNNALVWLVVFNSFFSVSKTLLYCTNVILAALYNCRTFILLPRSCYVHWPRSLVSSLGFSQNLFFHIMTVTVEYKKKQTIFAHFCLIKKGKTNKKTPTKPACHCQARIMHSSYIYQGLQARRK